MKKAFPVSCYAYLAALSIIFAYAVFESGGTLPSAWKTCMVAVGLLALVYFRYTRKDDLAPTLRWWFVWPPMLLLGFVGLQLVPLPMWLLRTVAPVHAQLSQSLDQVFPGTVSATISVYPPATLAHLFRVASYIVVFVITRELAWRARGRRWLVIAPVLLIAGAEAALGVFQYWQNSAASGTYANRNHFAGLLELSLPFAVVYPISAIMTRRRRSFRQAVLVSVSLALAALMLLGIMLSLSRTGFLASLSSLVTVGLLTAGFLAPGRRRFVVAVIVAAVLVAASFYLAPDQLIRRFSGIGGTSADLIGEARTRVWKDTWGLIADNPFVGCGLGAFEQAFTRYRTYLPELGVDTVHNDYLQFFAELGGIGFAIAGSGMMAVFLSAVYAIFRNIDSRSRYFAVASFAALEAILIHSFTDYNLYIPANAMLVAWISGLVSTLDFASEAHSQPDKRNVIDPGRAADLVIELP